MDEFALRAKLDKLEKSWSALDGWLDFWTILVVVGVVVELFVLITEYVHDWRDFKRGVIHSPEKPNILVFGLGFLGAALVAIGVAGEFRIHIEPGKIETDMRDTTSDLVALANGEAKAAGERAANADLKRVELQGKILAAFGPRVLSEIQMRRIAAKLSWPNRFKVDVYVFPLGLPFNEVAAKESADLARQLVRVLAASGIDVAGWVAASCWPTSMSAYNLVLSVSSPTPSFSIPYDIIEALKPEVATWPIVDVSDFLPNVCGDVHDLDMHRPNRRKPNATIKILVGSRVPPMLTPEFLGIEPLVKSEK